MDLHTIVSSAHLQKNHTIKGGFKTNIPVSDIGKPKTLPFSLTLIMAGNKRITFKVPQTPNLGEDDEKSMFRKTLVIKEKTDDAVTLHWTPAMQASERGFDIVLHFSGEQKGTFELTVRLPDTFTMWRDQTKEPRGIMKSDYAA